MKNIWPIKGYVPNLILTIGALAGLAYNAPPVKKAIYEEPRQALEQVASNPRLMYSGLERKITEANISHFSRRDDKKAFELIQETYIALPDSIEYLYFDMTSTLADIYRNAGDKQNAYNFGKKAVEDGNKVITAIEQGNLNPSPVQRQYFVKAYINALDQYGLIMKDIGDEKTARKYFEAARKQESKLSRMH